MVKAYFVFGIAMYIFFYRMISNSMLSQMNHPIFLFGDKEWFYQIFISSGIAQFLTGNTLYAAVFDVSLLVFTVGFLLSGYRIYAMLFSLQVLIYFLTYNVVTGHHYHGLIGLLVITIPFWFKNEKKFAVMWEAARYYFLYLFASAALWKILRGSAFYQEQLSDILKSQQINLLLQNPQNYRAHIIQYMISHTAVSHVVLLIDVVLQLAFVIGFFTKKFDTILFVLAIVFCIGNYFVMSILSAELLILNLTLLDWQKVETYLLKKEIITAQ